MTGDVVSVLNEAADAVARALAGNSEWAPTGAGHGQYAHDVVADRAALAVLEAAGLGVLSEESGLHNAGPDIVVVVDPVDGSTNASRGLPWWAVSLCALDSDGPLAAVVASPALGKRFVASRGKGAACNGQAIAPSGAVELGQAVLAFNGYPQYHYGWAQYRAFGSAALDLCAVACGQVDGFVDCSSLAPWDYLGGLLVCQEAGAVVQELFGRELVLRELGARRTLIAASTPDLLAQLEVARLRQAGR